MIKRAIISGLHSTGVQVADLRTLPAPVGKHHLKTQGYDAGVPRRRGLARSRGGADPALRTAGHRALGGVPEGDREALHAAGAAACAVRRRRRDHVSGSRARDVRERPALRAERRGDPRARVPDRGRLRLLGRQLGAAARRPDRSASRRSRRTRSNPTPAICRRGCARRSRARRGSCRWSTPTSARCSTARPSGCS